MKNIRELLKRVVSGPNETPAVTPAALLMPLEPRIVYDASVAAVGAASHHHFDGAEGAGHVGIPASAAELFRNSAVSGAVAGSHQSEGSGAGRYSARNTQLLAERSDGAEKQVVFVDPNVTDYESLLTGLPPGTQYVVLNPRTDGLEQIAQYLQSHPGVSAIHLLSHGSQGEVEVGGTVLDPNDLSAYRAELAQIGAAMKPGGDLLIYGCDVAEGRPGQGLVQRIAALTHLNVAAATDSVGAAALGGHWTLNYDVGDVRTPVIFSTATEKQYGYLLGQTVETYDAYANGGAGEVLASSVTSFTLDNITYTTDAAAESGVYTSATNNGNVDVAPLSTGATDGVLMLNDTGAAPMTEVTISLANGDPMSVSSFDFDEGLSNGNIFVIPNGNAAKEVLLSGSQLSGLVNLSGNANFKGVTSIEILDSGDSGNFTPTLNNFTYTDLSSPPQLTASGGSTAFTEGNNVAHTPSTPVTVDSGMSLTDGDSTLAATATVSIIAGFQHGDTLAFLNTSSTSFGNIGRSYNSATGVLSLSSTGGTATIAQWQAALEAVTYTDTAAIPSTAIRTVSFNVNDGLGSAGPSNTVTKNVTVADTDQIPVVTTTGGTTNYERGASAVTIDSGVTVTDSDTLTQSSGTVSIGTGFHSGDALSFTNDSATLYGNISVSSYDSATGVLTLTSSSATATDAQWAKALDAVTFSSTSTNYGDRTVSFVTNDGTSNSAAATHTLDLTAPPTITTDSGSGAFVAGDNVASTPVHVDSGLTLTDASSLTLVSATASISGNFSGGEDVLGFTNDGSTMGNIAGSYSAATGVLTLTSSSDSASLAQWQAALAAVAYTDAAVTPNNATRTISFSVTDLNNVTSNTAARNVTVADTDQTPIVTTTGGTTLNYFGGASAQTIDGGIAVSDLDNTTQSSGTVSITTGFHRGDTLSFTNGSATQYGNISVSSYDSATGVLTLTSSGASATDAQWASALSAVTFSSTSTGYGARTISFVTNDGTENSAAATDAVNMTNPLSVTTDSGSAAFVAGDNTASTPVTVDSGLTLTDGSTSTADSATVSITSNFHSGEDVLAFNNTSSAMFGDIAASYNAATGVLALTSSSGSASIAQWQAALDAVTYTDTAITPNSATRTISFSVTDFNNVTSNTATRNVTVADTDQTPILTTTGGTTSYVGGGTATPIDSGITVSDLDNATQSTGTVSIGTGFHSGDTLSFTNTSATLFADIAASYNSATGVMTLSSSGAIATDAQWANALSAVAFSAGAGATPGNRTISFVTNDGTKSSAAATDTVDVLGPPTLTADSGSASYVEGDNTVSTVAVDSGLTLTDGSASTADSATVAITGNFHSGEDVLSLTNNPNTMGNITGSYNAVTGVLTLTSAGNAATLAQWQAALDSVTYSDTAATPNTATRTISFSLTDGNANVSNTATRNVTVADTDQMPIVTTSGVTTNYVGGASAVTIDSGVTVSDLDNSTQLSGTVSIGTGFHSGDTLSFTNTSATLFANITASYNSATGVMTLSSSGAIATDAQWANALGAATFSAGASATPGNRTISFVTNDGTKSSAAATDTVDVLGPPSVTTDSGSAGFVAGDNVTSTAIVVDSGITLFDASSGTLSSATVAVTGNFHAGEDLLSFANNGSTMGNIAASYDATTGVLTLTSSGASATLAQWQAALQSVTYTDTAVTPNNATRTVSFAVIDGNSNASNVATRTVTVADTDQTPIVTATGGTANYVGGTAAAVVDAGVSVSDLDNSTQSSGTVSIGTGFHSGDTLSFTNTSATTFGNITASYDAATGVMTLSSSGAIATDAQWANALSAVTFSAGAGATPGNRTISFVTNDGTMSSAAATDTVDVLGPPSVTTDSGSAAFVAGDNVTSTPVVVDSGITLLDASSTTMSSATVAVSGNFHAGEDVLSFSNNGSAMGNIAASYDATTGVLTLTSSGAAATLAQWQAALQSVTYTDTAVTPNNATRTVSFAAIDGNSHASNVATRAVTVADTDQTPILTATPGKTGYVAGTDAIAVDAGVTVSDRDNTAQSSATVSIGGGFDTGDTLSFTNTSATVYGNISASYNSTTGVMTLASQGGTATDAQWASALEAVKFSTASNTAPGDRTIAFVINDGTKSSIAATKTLNVVGPPSIAADSGAASFIAADNAASTPVVVDPGIGVSDQGSAVLASATVAVTGNFHSGEDVLSFTNSASTMGDISGSYNAATGVLTLTSTGASATLAQWQAALQSVTYTDTAVTPNAALRTISFGVVDGNGMASSTASRTVTVRDNDQTPVVATTGGATGYEAGSPPATIDSGIAISDRDNMTLASATVTISAGFRNGDQLSLGLGGATYGNIAASYNASTGVLTLTSSGATASLSQWQAALEAVQFSSPATAPAGSRTISFAVDDGTDIGAVATKTVGVVNFPFAPAKMPNTVVESTAADDNSVTTANQATGAIPLIVLTALDPQEFANTSPNVQTVTFSSASSAGGASNGAMLGRGLFGDSSLSTFASNALQQPGSTLSSRYWLSAPLDLQGPIDVPVSVEHLDFASQQPFSLALVPHTHGDGQDAASTISLEQSDGSPLPAWMHYDAATGVVSGIAPGTGPREIHIVVITRHSSGAATRRDVVIDFSVRGSTSTHGMPVQPRAPHAALHGAKPSLTEQFASQRRAIHVSRLSHTTRPNQVA